MTTKKFAYYLAGILIGESIIFLSFLLGILFINEDIPTIVSMTGISILAVGVGGFIYYLLWENYNKNYKENDEKKN